jgi:hypothetical protein
MKNVSSFSSGELRRNEPPYRVVRDHYRVHCRDIQTTHDLRATLRAGAHSSIGGYQLFLATSDSETLCFECARSEYRQVSDSIRNHSNDGWRVVGCDVNYEDTSMFCAHCNQQIPASYASDEENANHEDLST